MNCGEVLFQGEVTVGIILQWWYFWVVAFVVVIAEAIVVFSAVGIKLEQLGKTISLVSTGVLRFVAFFIFFIIIDTHV
jgi:hypothetical protein